MRTRSGDRRRVALCLGIACLLVLTAALLACGTSSRPIALHTPKFLVALDDTGSTDNVNVFSVDGSTGALTAVSSSPFTTGLLDGAGAVVHPTHGNWVFAADWAGNVQALVMGADGTPAVASTAASGYGSFGWVSSGLAVSADGKYLYTTTNSTDLVVWSIDQTTAALTKSGTYTTPLTWTYGVAVSGGFLYVNDDNGSNRQVHVASIGSNGQLTSVQTVTVPVPTGINGYELWSVTVDKTGKFLFVGDENCTITTYSIASNGQLTFVGAATRNAGDGDMDTMSVSADNKFLYATTDRAGGAAAFSINQSTGALTEITGSPFDPALSSYGTVLVDPSSKFVYVSEDCSDIIAYKRNQTDGTLGPLSGTTPTTYTTKYTASCGFAVTW
jgi:6-phosphogluconolactonase